jgi:hypothetical protein
VFCRSIAIVIGPTAARPAEAFGVATVFARCVGFGVHGVCVWLNNHPTLVHQNDARRTAAPEKNFSDAGPVLTGTGPKNHHNPLAQNGCCPAMSFADVSACAVNAGDERPLVLTDGGIAFKVNSSIITETFEAGTPEKVS